jgi:hypothetical protein
MAEIIPSLTQHTLARMTSGEKRVARRLQSLLEDDYLVWYDIPVGKHRRHPDFIILHPGRGLLFLEVKDWKPETVRDVSKVTVELLTDSGRTTVPNPLEQAKGCAYQVIDILSRDPALQQTSREYFGKLVVPYGWGVVFTNITRKQIRGMLPDPERDLVIPDHLAIYKDDITESADAETFQSQLWGMFTYQFGGRLTLPQIDRIRWHLFPEIRIDHAGQPDLFTDPEEQEESLAETLPDIVKVLDIQQEQLARSSGKAGSLRHRWRRRASPARGSATARPRSSTTHAMTRLP